MELGAVKISVDLIALVVLGAIGWALLHARVVPRAMSRLEAARGSDVVSAASRLLLMKSLRSIAASLVIAPVAVMLIYGISQWRVEAGAADPQKVESLIATRGLLESVLEPLTALSLGTWIVALVSVAVFWIVATVARSRSSWKRALEARRRAHDASAALLSDDALLDEAEQLDAGAVSQLRAKVDRVEQRNRAQIAEAETARMFTMGQKDGEPQLMALADLRRLAADLEDHASNLEAAARASVESASPTEAPEQAQS